jgi:hypothetical protein
VDSKKYKVQGDTKNSFMDIELDLVLEDDSIGASCKVLGGEFTITQNGPILVLVDKDWCLTLLDITPEPEKAVPKLIINETLEIFTETKEIAVKCKCTYEELYYALKEEWPLLQKALPLIGEMPFDYSQRLMLFTFRDGWGFENGNYGLLSEGSFERINSEGRHF